MRNPDDRSPPGVELYTVREALAAEGPALFEKIAAAGYDAVETGGPPANLVASAAELRAAGLQVCCAHANPNRDGFEALAEAAAVLGTRTVIVSSLDREHWDSGDLVRGHAEQMNQWGRQAAAQGLRLGYHNHYWEWTEIDGTTAFDHFVTALDETIVIELDAYWARVGGQDVVALLHRLGERVRYLHLKDGPATDVATAMVALGTGAMPLEEILAAAPAMEWPIVEIDRCATDMLTAVRESAAWWRSQGSGRS